jgi:phage gp36-like protein
MMKAEDADLDRAMKLETMRAELKRNAKPRREHIKHALENGCKNLEYLALRYNLPLEAIEKAKRIWGL